MGKIVSQIGLFAALLGFLALRPAEAAPSALVFASATERVSVASGGTQANQGSYFPSISADGRYVAFKSAADNLVPGDTNGQVDIFVRDRQLGTTEIVSVASDGTKANDWSDNPAISADGRFVVFNSTATNLVSGDTNGFHDVFLHDRQTKITERISIATNTVQANNHSLYPSISANGNLVAFESRASNLVSGDTNSAYDIFVRDRLAGTTTLLSLGQDGSPANHDSQSPAISADGRVIAFESRATNLVAGDSNGIADIFIRDRLSESTERINVSSGGDQSNGQTNGLALSADGRFVIFNSLATNLVSGDTNDTWDAFLRDRQAGTTERVSIAQDGSQANAYSFADSISADGRYITLTTYANNLAAGDTNGQFDVLLRDRQTGTNEIVSVSSTGDQGNQASGTGAISADGRTIAFESDASNLVSGDTNLLTDIFVRDRDFPEHTYTISGRVTRADGSPLAGLGLFTDTGASTTTALDGAYHLTNVPAGSVEVFPQGTGYLYNPGSVSIDLASDRVGINFIASLAVCGSAANLSAAVDDGVMCLAPAAEPFLYLPVDSQFAPEVVLQDTDYGGRVDSWFDHRWPTYGYHGYPTNRTIQLFDGILLDDFTKMLDNGLGCYNSRCYDQHDGLDFSRFEKQEGRTVALTAVLPAASGTVLETCHRDSDKYPGESCNRASSLGRYVVIAHRQNTYATLYAHLAWIAEGIAVGVEVTRNDYSTPYPIGEMGGSGSDRGAPLNEKYYPIHLHFQVFFNASYHTPWTPDWNEVVDPFGWLPESGQDSWILAPSVPLWKDFHPVSCIPAGGQATISTGAVTVQIPAGAVGDGQAVTLSPTASGGPASLPLRGLGTAFALNVIDLVQTQNIGKAPSRVDGVLEPVTVTARYAGQSNPHLVLGELAFYRYNQVNAEWDLQPTTLDSGSSTASMQVVPEGIFALQAPLICPADLTEPADDFPSINEVIFSRPQEITLSRWFDIAEDRDWFSLETLAGVTYTIETQNLSPGVDTVLTLYDFDGETILIEDDNSGGAFASRISFQAPNSGVYFVRVSPAETSAIGCASAYQVRMRNDLLADYLPAIFSR